MTPTDAKKPREFWIETMPEGEPMIWETPLCEAQNDDCEVIHVREVSQSNTSPEPVAENEESQHFTDTQMLDWVINFQPIFLSEKGYHFIHGFRELGVFKNPRETIDATMKESKK